MIICDDCQIWARKYKNFLRRFEALARTSERQSECLARALKEKNDALQRMRIQTDQLTAARQEVFELRIRSLCKNPSEQIAQVMKDIGWKQTQNIFVPTPKYEVGQTVLVKSAAGLHVCKIAQRVCVNKEGFVPVWQYRSKSNTFAHAFTEDQIRPLTEEQLR